jgi:hypothetical protein
MAHFYVRNSLNYDQTVKINISFVRGYDINANDGDPRWFLELGTKQTSANGTPIAPQYVNNVTDVIKLNELVADAVAKIAAQIDWEPLVHDDSAPYIEDIIPAMIDSGVPIESNLDITIKDDMPSSGLDLSDVKITMTTRDYVFDITDECDIEGTPFEYRFHWEPPARNCEYYGG